MGSVTVAVVEDDPISLDILVHALEEVYGATVFAFSHPKAALDFLHKQSPDSLKLVITDLIMPAMNGIELLLKTREAGLMTPFIFITSDVTRETVIKARRAGASAFIGKPVGPEALKQKVDEVLGISDQSADNV